MRALELKIPPLALVALFCLMMWLAARYASALFFPFPARLPLAIAAATLGLLVVMAGVLAFRSARTTLEPRRPDESSTLVKSGIYRFSRNPMYLGFLLILGGWALYLSNALAILGLPVFVIYMNHFQIRPEERALRTRFGEVFVAYQNVARRWL